MPLTTTRTELLVDGSDRKFRKLVHDFLAFTARHEALRNGHGRRIGLAGIEYTILISIAHLGRLGPVNVKDIADHLHVSTGFVTNATRKLQGLGLIEKQRGRADRRTTELTVTDKGLKRLETLAPYQRQVNDAEFGSLSREQFGQLCRIVEDLVGTSDAALALQKSLESDGEAS
ncbi:MAG: MarR family transcriptional regulator [Rhodospirillaceae bacterium]